MTWNGFLKTDKWSLSLKKNYVVMYLTAGYSCLYLIMWSANQSVTSWRLSSVLKVLLFLHLPQDKSFLVCHQLPALAISNSYLSMEMELRFSRNDGMVCPRRSKFVCSYVRVSTSFSFFFSSVLYKGGYYCRAALFLGG